MKRWMAGMVFAVAGTVGAQQGQQIAIPTCSNTKGADGFTECERVYMAHYNEEVQPYQQKINEVNQEYGRYIGLLLSQHPEMTYEPQSPQWPFGRLIPKAQAAKDAKKPAAAAAKAAEPEKKK